MYDCRRKIIAGIFILIISAACGRSEKLQPHDISSIVEVDSLMMLAEESSCAIQSRIYIRLSEVLLVSGDTLKAKSFARESLHRAEICGEELDQLAGNYQFGKILFKQDSLQASLKYFEKAIKLSQECKMQGEMPHLVGFYEGRSLFRKAQIYHRIYSDSSKIILETLLQAIEKLSNPDDYKILADSYELLGQHYLGMGIQDKGLENSLKAIDYYNQVGDTGSMAKVYGMLSYEVDRVTAIEYMQKAIELYSLTNDSSGMARYLVNLAFSARNMIDENENLAYLNRAYSIYESNTDYPGMIYCLFHMSTFYLNVVKDHNAMMNVLSKAVEIINRHKIIKGAGHIYINLATFYLSQKQADSAAFYYRKADSITMLLPESAERIRFLAQVGRFYLSQQKYNQAERYMEEAVTAADKQNDHQIKRIAYRSLYLLHNEKGDFEKALHYYRELTIQNEKVLNENTERVVAEMQIRFDTERMKDRLLMMEKDQAIKSVELRKKELTIVSITGSLILIICFSLLLSRQYIIKRKAYKKLMEKNLQLINAGKSALNNKSAANNNNHHLNLDDELKQKILNKLNYQIKKNKIYLSGNLTLNQLAKKCQTNTSYLSNIIHSEFNTNFNGFINELRIREAQKYLADENYRSYSMEGISKLVGFNTKAVFNQSFKKYTGVTPSFYLEFLKENKAKKSAKVPG